VSGLQTLRRLRTTARDEASEAFSRRLAELRLAEELLRRAAARWESQRGRCAVRAEARLGALGAGQAAARAMVHARHEARLRDELEVLAFGRQVARRELAARSARIDEARDALGRAEASLAVLERLLERREEEARRRRLRREEQEVEASNGRLDQTDRNVPARSGAR
jgi:flagellar biosynthesis chaperone FliJ